MSNRISVRNAGLFSVLGYLSACDGWICEPDKWDSEKMKFALVSLGKAKSELEKVIAESKKHQEPTTPGGMT